MHHIKVPQNAAIVLALNPKVQVGGRSQPIRLSVARTCTQDWLAFGPLGIAHRLKGRKRLANTPGNVVILTELLRIPKMR